MFWNNSIFKIFVLFDFCLISSDSVSFQFLGYLYANGVPHSV